MQAAILSLLTGDPSVDELPSKLDGEWPAYDVQSTEYLDGQRIHHGTLAAHIEVQERVPMVGEDFITHESEPRRQRVATDFYADLDAGWAGVDTSDGIEVLEGFLGGTAGVMPEDTRLDLDAWVSEYAQRDDAELWAASYSLSESTGHAEERATAAFHADADTETLPSSGVSAVGFNYTWNGHWIRGLVASSGYVAVYSGLSTSGFARWVTDEIQPYLHHASEGQATLDEDTAEDLNDTDASSGADAGDDEQERFSDLDTVNVEESDS